MRTPFQIHNQRKEKRELEDLIKYESKEYERTLNENIREKLIRLHKNYEIKYERGYKG